MYELKASYADGHRDGRAFAEHHFNLWQDREGPPFAWPRGSSDIGEFVEDCVPRMHLVLQRKLASDARAAGISLDDLAIPRDFIRGVEEGYRTRLTELVRGFVQRRSMFRY